MSIALVKEASTASGTTNANLVFESDLTDFPAAISELSHADTRKKAMVEASQLGISSPRCGMPSHPYAIDPTGNLISKPKEQTIHRYRVDVPIMSGVM